MPTALRNPRQKDLTFLGKVDDVDRGEKTLTVKVSTDQRDRDDEVIIPKGIQLKNFRSNPVVLWAHRYQDPPIAKSLWEKSQKDCLLAKPKFAPNEFSQGIFDLYADDYLKAWSIGFLPLDGKSHAPNEKDLTDRPDWAGVRRIHDECELLEYSGCPVPSNAGALSLALRKGLWLPPELRAIAEAEVKGHVHDHNVHHDPPDWEDVDQSKLPRKAFGDRGEPGDPPSWMYAHHHVEGATKENDDGRHSDGTMYLHVEGLRKAKEQATRDGAPSHVHEHLDDHCERVGIPTDEEHYQNEHDEEEADKSLPKCDCWREGGKSCKCKCHGKGETEPKDCACCCHDKCKCKCHEPDKSAKALTHNSTLSENEPGWGDVDKTKLPRNAHADMGEADRKSTWKFPHHWVKGGKLGEDGVFESGEMFLHRGGLAAAWSAANGGRSGEEASAAVKSHLNAHRKAIGMGEQDDGKPARSVEPLSAPRYSPAKEIVLADPAKPEFREIASVEEIEREEEARLRGKMTVGGP